MITISSGRGLLLGLVFLISIAAVAAQDFDVEQREIDRNFQTGKQAVFELDITNNGEDDTFRFSTVDVLWNIQSQPLFHYFSGIDIAAGETETVRLLLNPSTPPPPGLYEVKITVRSEETDATQIVPIVVFVRSDAPALRDYLAAVTRIVEIPPEIDPRDANQVKINLENRNPKIIDEMEIILSSNLINGVIKTDLQSLQQKTVVADIELDPLTPPQEDTLVVTLVFENKTLQPIIKEKFEIVAYGGVEPVNVKKRNIFFKLVDETTFVNDGNAPASATIEKKINFLTKLFTSSSTPGSYTITREEGSYLAWDVELDPQEELVHIVSTDYRPVIFVIIVAILAYIAYILLRSPVIVRKEATVVGFRENGISELKVLIHIKNRSNRSFERITVSDRLPHIADVHEDIEVGTLKPTKIHQGNRGTIVTWNIENLDKLEERVLSYRMRSKLSILGGFTLPIASVKFFDSAGRRFRSKSKKYKIRA